MQVFQLIARDDVSKQAPEGATRRISKLRKANLVVKPPDLGKELTGGERLFSAADQNEGGQRPRARERGDENTGASLTARVIFCQPVILIDAHFPREEISQQITAKCILCEVGHSLREITAFRRGRARQPKAGRDAGWTRAARSSARVLQPPRNHR